MALFTQRVGEHAFLELPLETVRKVPEVPERGPTRRLKRLVRPVLAPIHEPNTRSERHSDPFSDSFLTEFSEVHQEDFKYHSFA